jgi:hypothetical protein
MSECDLDLGAYSVCKSFIQNLYCPPHPVGDGHVHNLRLSGCKQRIVVVPYLSYDGFMPKVC